MHILQITLFIFGFINEKTDITKIYIFKKKSKVFFQIKKFAAKLKTQKNTMQKFKSNNRGKFDFKIYK